MLSMSKVLYYIKTMLGHPHVVIEKSDAEMEMHIKLFALNEFSKYIPSIHELPLRRGDPTVRIKDNENTYILKDPDGCDILNVVAVLQEESSMFLYGYPWFAEINSIDNVATQLLMVDEAETREMFSRGHMTFNFMPPNKVRIYPAVDDSYDKFLIRYERVQPETLSEIPPEFQQEFLTLCLADVMIMCGNIRNKYQNISTPFGEIPLNAELGSKGEEIKTNILTELRKQPPNILLDIG